MPLMLCGAVEFLDMVDVEQLWSELEIYEKRINYMRTVWEANLGYTETCRERGNRNSGRTTTG